MSRVPESVSPALLGVMTMLPPAAFAMVGAVETMALLLARIDESGVPLLSVRPVAENELKALPLVGPEMTS
jgi:hypothetical protein